MNNLNNNQNKVQPSQRKKISPDGYEYEFSEDLYDAAGRVGFSPIVGGLITRNLVKEGEEIIMANDRNTTKPSK